uniref:Unannotated protein n=1 Tax=freshwater metagenome TaxID=449393 RepID=A0A6J6A0B0_9ZZZZ
MGTRAVGGLADETLVHGNVAPSEEDLPLYARVQLHKLLQLATTLGILRHETDSDRVEALGRQFEVEDSAQEGVWNLNEDSGSVAAVYVGALAAAVLEIVERFERLLNNPMGRDVVKFRDHRDAASVMLVGRVVEALRPWSRIEGHR